MDNTLEHKLCRLCLCSSGDLIDIFEESGKLEFVVEKAVEDLLQLKVSKEPGYPWLVCSTCLSKLIEFRMFKRRCIECQLVFDNRVHRRNLTKAKISKNGQKEIVIKEEFNHAEPVMDVVIGREEEESDKEYYQEQGSHREIYASYEVSEMEELVIDASPPLEDPLAIRGKEPHESRGRELQQDDCFVLGSRQVAHENSSIAHNESDLDVETKERGQEKRKYSYENWSLESGHGDQLSCGKKFKKLFAISPKIVESGKLQQSSGPELIESPLTEPSTQDQRLVKASSFEDKALRSLLFLKQSLVGIEMRLTALEQAGKSQSENQGMADSTKLVLAEYPIGTSVHLDEVEMKLQDKSYQKQLVSALIIIGGNSAKDFTVRMLRTLLKDSVAEEYSWLGLKGKKAFSKLLLKDVIYDAVRTSIWSKTYNKDIESYIMNWLRNAKFRGGIQGRSVVTLDEFKHQK